MVAALFEPPMTTESGFIEVDNSYWEQRFRGDESYDVWVVQIDRHWVGRTYSETVGPTWNDAFQAWNEEYVKRWNKTINRRWNADPDAMAAKLLIDSDYLRLVSEYNLSHKNKVKANTAILGTDVQPNVYIPDAKTGSFFSQIAPFVALGLAFAGIPAFIGSSIMGASAAAAYPLAAQALGNVVIGTVINGGNIEKAATSAIIGMAGGYVGDFAGTGLDSEQLGKVAARVTVAAIKNENIGVAAASAYLSDSVLTTTAVPVDDYFDYSSVADFGIDVDVISVSDSLSVNETILNEAGIAADSIQTDAAGNNYYADGSYIQLAPETYAESYYLSDSGICRPDNSVLMTVGEFDALLANDPNYEQTIASRIMTDWENSQDAVVESLPDPVDRPTVIPPPGPVTKIPTIGDTLKTFESVLKTVGTIVTVGKAISKGTYIPGVTGTPRVQTVGVPILRPDGSVVVNNGNGTQTVTRPDGTQTTTSTTYTGQGLTGIFSGVSTNTLLIGAGVALAVFALR